MRGTAAPARLYPCSENNWAQRRRVISEANRRAAEPQQRDPPPACKDLQTGAGLLLPVEIPAKAEAVGRLVELALIEIYRASIVEAKDRVVQIQTRGNRSKASAEPVAALDINLEMREEVVIALGSFSAARDGSWIHRDDFAGVGVNHKVLKHIGIDVRAVISEAHAYREGTPIIGGADIPGVPSLVEERRAVRAKRVHAGGA